MRKVPREEIYSGAIDRTVVAYIRNQWEPKSVVLGKLASSLLNLTHNLNITFTAHYLSGTCNDVMDSLSRGSTPKNWRLTRKAAQFIYRKWGTPQIDLFATH